MINKGINLGLEPSSVYLFTKIQNVLKNESHFIRVSELEEVLDLWFDLDLMSALELEVNYFKSKEDLREKFLKKYISEKLYSLNV